MTPEQKRDNFKKLYRDELISLINLIATDVDPEEHSNTIDPECLPSIQITVACDDNMSTYRYQTGDNSFTGSCYSMPHWAVGYVTRLDNDVLADELIDQLYELIPED